MIATLDTAAGTDLETPPELPEEFYDVARICKMLSEPSRLRIVFFLMHESELNVGVICGRLNQSQPAVSHHLAFLKRAGLVKVRRDGKHNFYSLCRERFHQIILSLFETIADTSEDGLRFDNFVRRMPLRVRPDMTATAVLLVCVSLILTIETLHVPSRLLPLLLSRLMPR